MSNVIKFATITEHLTIDECADLTLKDVVERPGFQAVRIVQLTENDTQKQITMVAIQSVEMLGVETNAGNN